MSDELTPREPPGRVAEAFQVQGTPVAVQPLVIGRIHDTYLVTREAGGRNWRYILQRINPRVFGSPGPMMDNIRRVTGHLRQRLAQEGHTDRADRVLSVVPARDGKSCWRDGEGAWWRMYTYVENTRSYDGADTPVVAYCGARAFGDFVRLLSDLPGPGLHETIPHFHDTPARLSALKQAIEADGLNRAAGARDAIDFALKREPFTRLLADRQAAGDLPERIVHNDTKINNVLFDRDTDEAVCVVDLDTVMPGLVLHDFGDLVRTTASPAGEEERDLDRIEVRLRIFEAVVEGYMAGAGASLSAREVDLMPWGAQVITLELGMRFLTDHLAGDSYFRTTRPGQNLDRARKQFRLLECMEAAIEEMAGVVERLWNRARLT